MVGAPVGDQMPHPITGGDHMAEGAGEIRPAPDAQLHQVVAFPRAGVVDEHPGRLEPRRAGTATPTIMLDDRHTSSADHCGEPVESARISHVSQLSGSGSNHQP